MGSDLGIPDEKILALEEYATNALYDERERVALRYADAITLSERDVDEAITAVIAWENASSKFNRALRVPSQGLWKRRDR